MAATSGAAHLLQNAASLAPEQQLAAAQTTVKYGDFADTLPITSAGSQMPSLEIQIIMCLFYGTLAFTAVTSNLIVCYIVLSNRGMRTALNYFIVNLAVGDILMALLCIPFTFTSNLLLTYWPFGEFLCVLVTYSQTISVFVSAYTMVAISIDKYMAIMYPMRLKMPKQHAKLIILVIWSAALLTSLPTALLSQLHVASSLDLVIGGGGGGGGGGPVSGGASGSAPLEAPLDAPLPPEATPISGNASSSAAPQPQPVANHAEPAPAEALRPEVLQEAGGSRAELATNGAGGGKYEHRTYCEENWTFWPAGKSYYSMALMILQFVLPLFVLVITYSRIFVIVWGKRMPGEEDNARDARMARSKRKMIKMVILCVIAFALTWLPFNVLLLYGDYQPSVWDHQHMWLIWFVTHYLAMCHTITNPLIYIWMNHRFRAGFKQVVGDLCRLFARCPSLCWRSTCASHNCRAVDCCCEATFRHGPTPARSRAGPTTASGAAGSRHRKSFQHSPGASAGLGLHQAASQADFQLVLHKSSVRRPSAPRSNSFRCAHQQNASCGANHKEAASKQVAVRQEVAATKSSPEECARVGRGGLSAPHPGGGPHHKGAHKINIQLVSIEFIPPQAPDLSSGNAGTGALTWTPGGARPARKRTLSSETTTELQLLSSAASNSNETPSHQSASNYGAPMAPPGVDVRPGVAAADEPGRQSAASADPQPAAATRKSAGSINQLSGQAAAALNEGPSSEPEVRLLPPINKPAPTDTGRRRLALLRRLFGGRASAKAQGRDDL